MTFLLLQYFEEPIGKGKYEFRIGSRALLGRNSGTSIPGQRHALNILGINHQCLLLDNDIFEYGDKGYARHRDVGQDPNYDWKSVPVDRLGMNTLFYVGRTNISPDDLEKMIIENGSWTGEKYNYIFHNCQSFVQWCRDKIYKFNTIYFFYGNC